MTQVTPASKPASNPYDQALAAIWVIGILLGVVLLAVGFLHASANTQAEVEQTWPILGWGIAIAGLGFVSLIAHLASLAARWTPTVRVVEEIPEGSL
jgi:hypothetical protein